MTLGHWCLSPRASHRASDPPLNKELEAAHSHLSHSPTYPRGPLLSRDLHSSQLQAVFPRLTLPIASPALSRAACVQYCAGVPVSWPLACLPSPSPPLARPHALLPRARRAAAWDHLSAASWCGSISSRRLWLLHRIWRQVLE